MMISFCTVLNNDVDLNTNRYSENYTHQSQHVNTTAVKNRITHMET